MIELLDSATGEIIGTVRPDDDQSLMTGLARLALAGRRPVDAAGALVGAALAVLIEAKHTPGDAARLVVGGVNKGLAHVNAKVNAVISALAGSMVPR